MWNKASWGNKEPTYEQALETFVLIVGVKSLSCKQQHGLGSLGTFTGLHHKQSTAKAQASKVRHDSPRCTSAMVASRLNTTNGCLDDQKLEEDWRIQKYFMPDAQHGKLATKSWKPVNAPVSIWNHYLDVAQRGVLLNSQFNHIKHVKVKQTPCKQNTASSRMHHLINSVNK